MIKDEPYIEQMIALAKKAMQNAYVPSYEPWIRKPLIHSANEEIKPENNFDIYKNI